MPETEGLDPTTLGIKTGQSLESRDPADPTQEKSPETVALDLPNTPDNSARGVKKAVEAGSEKEFRGAVLEKAHVVSLETKELHDAARSVRYEVKVEVPLKGKKVYSRTLKFTVPEADRAAFLESRSLVPTQVHMNEQLIQVYRDSAQAMAESEHGDRPGSPTPEDIGKKYQEVYGFTPGENVVGQPVNESIEQEIVAMLRSNYFDLQPRIPRLEKPAGRDEQLVFNIDHRKFSIPFGQVKDRVEVVLGLLGEGALPLLKKYREMPFEKVLRMPQGDEKNLALQILATFAGIPTRALESAQAYVDKGKTDEILQGYELAKQEESRLSLGGRGKQAVKTGPKQETLYIFETLGLRLRNGNYSFAAQAAQDALLKRLHREPWEREQRKDMLTEAKEFIRGLDLIKLGFSGLEKKIKAAGPSRQMEEKIYVAAILDTGYSARDVIENFHKKDILGHIPSMEVNRTAARIAIEESIKRSKNKDLPNYSDREYFESGNDVTFKDSEDKRSGTFVAKKRTQAVTGQPFVDVAIIRQAREGEEQRKDRVFHLPIRDNSIIDSLASAKEFRDIVAQIFYDRHQKEGQQLSFVPHISLAKGVVKNNPKFKLVLGSAEAVVDYKALYDSLSFKNKVEAELTKAIYVDNKKAGEKGWDKMPEWKKQAIYLLQNIIFHSGLPSLTEQLIVKEIKNRFEKQRTAAPVISKGRKVVVTGEKGRKKPVEAPIAPKGVISPDEQRRLDALKAEAETKPVKKKREKSGPEEAAVKPKVRAEKTEKLNIKKRAKK